MPPKRGDDDLKHPGDDEPLLKLSPNATPSSPLRENSPESPRSEVELSPTVSDHARSNSSIAALLKSRRQQSVNSSLSDSSPILYVIIYPEFSVYFVHIHFFI